LKKSFRFVRRDDRFCITGVSASKNGENDLIASLMSVPRPASASPNPVSASCW
jgi:hypothetical protein